MTEETTTPADTTPDDSRKDVWLRGLWMLILVALFSLAQGLLVACAVLQFGWLLFAKQKNQHIAGFGEKLGNWLAATARFQSGATEDKPFPWSKWE
ncbi:DUF4389 domain-containing protein [Actibacterium sp.]|uniref:DUF4389 domain-containing protein n=1 Tax=Actibacterium sp. TaxID=1872125 RepID=UPI00356462C6